MIAYRFTRQTMRAAMKIFLEKEWINNLKKEKKKEKKEKKLSLTLPFEPFYFKEIDKINNKNS